MGANQRKKNKLQDRHCLHRAAAQDALDSTKQKTRTEPKPHRPENNQIELVRGIDPTAAGAQNSKHAIDKARALNDRAVLK